MTYRAEERIVSHPVDRVELSAHVPLSVLRTRLEELLPEVDVVELERLVDASAPWEEFARAARAPYELMRIPGAATAPLMRIAGVDTPSATFELTNLVLLARAFRHDPGVAVAMPFRLELHGAGPGVTVVAFDRPGSRFASFGNNKIAQVGVELDRAVGDLLEAVDLPRPSVLRR